MTGIRLELRLTGPVSVARAGAAAALPRSRKVLALLGYLALEGPQPRSRLCDLLWDVPNDPKGELRWCLSKLRTLLDHPDRPRVVATGTAQVGLDLTGAAVDVLEILGAAAEPTDALPTERLLALEGLFRGDLLEGVDIDATSDFTTWLAGQRHRFRTLRLGWARALALRPSPHDAEAFRRLQGWLRAAPVDQEAHQAMLMALVQRGRVSEAEDHFAHAVRAFEQDAVDWTPLRTWWRGVRGRPAPEDPARVVVLPRAPDPSSAPDPRGRASVAVLPFADEPAAPAGQAQVGPGLSCDIVTQIAKLRGLFVIARGTTQALHERGVEAQEAGRILDVDYVVTGRVRRHGEGWSVLVELAETERASIVWTDELAGRDEATFDVLETVASRIVATIAEEIEVAECRRALLKRPGSLDAWEAYHRGLWHMYRFTAADNKRAAELFRRAIELDATFARPHAGLSFTHFQNVFLGLEPDRERQIGAALETAAESLARDDRDPAAHWAMGRALWLEGSVRESVDELERSVDLSPNFALGHYTLGFVEAQSGDPRKAIDAAHTSRQLSPFDPLQFGMLGSLALAHMRLGELDEAVEWALRAIARPNAHVHILAIAAAALALANRRDEGRKIVRRIRERVSDYTIETFLAAFRFEPETALALRQSARRIDFSG